MDRKTKRLLNKRKKQKKVIRILITIVLTAVLAAMMILAGLYAFPEVYGRRTFRGTTSYSLKDANCTDFSGIYTFPKLLDLDLRGNTVSEELYLQLQRDFPGCTILWDAPIDGRTEDSTAETLTFNEIPADFEHVAYFPKLKEIVILQPKDQDAMLLLKDSWPQYKFSWSVLMNGEWYAPDTTELTVKNSEDIYAEVTANLKYFQNLKTVHMEDTLFSLEEQKTLRTQFPDLEFSWMVPLWGNRYASGSETIALSVNEEPNLVELNDALFVMNSVKTIQMDGTLLNAALQRQLKESYPELKFTWAVSIWGSSFAQDAESITLVMDKKPDMKELDDAFHVMDALKNVSLSGTRLTLAMQRGMKENYPNLNFIWAVNLWGQTFDQNAESISLSAEQSLVLTEFEDAVHVFHGLKNVSISGALLTPAIQKQLQTSYPQLHFSWKVQVWGSTFESDAQSISLTSAETPDLQELEDALDIFTSLTTIEAGGKGLTTTIEKQLKHAHPELTFLFTVTLGEDTFTQNTTALHLSATSAPSLQELEDSLDVFDGLKTVDFTGSGVPGEIRIQFKQNHPDMDISWRTFIMGQEYPMDTTYLDFSGQQLSEEDVESIRRGAAELPNLTTVEMHDCGVANEVLSRMNEENERVRYIWTVYFANYSLRTDAKFFMPAMWEYGETLFNSNSRDLQYCIDLECLDLGHSCVEDYFFLQYMPHMKYLILVDSSILSLEYVSYCKELVFLETFCTYIRDLSPLLECTALEDLNIGYVRCSGDDAFNVLKQMTWLKRLWYCGCPMTRDQMNQLKTLLPNTEQYVRTGGQSTGSTWRLGQNYYDMRDLLDMPYMPGGTLGVNWQGWQCIEDDWGNRFVLEYWDGEQKWWEEKPFCNWDWHIVGINCELP